MQKDVPRAETDQFGNFQRTYKHLKRMESCSVCSMKIRKKKASDSGEQLWIDDE